LGFSRIGGLGVNDGGGVTIMAGANVLTTVGVWRWLWGGEAEKLLRVMEAG